MKQWEKMSQHQAKVVKISEILKHPNADSLGLVEVDGFQVVVRLDQFKPGDLAIYIEPDSIVPAIPQFKFVWERDGAGQPREIAPDQEILERWRRVTVRKFRKEWSEGLLMPVSDFFSNAEMQIVLEGEDVAERLGITHWNPPEDQEDRDPSVKQSRTRPKSFKGWVHFVKNWAIKIITLGQYDPWGNLGGQNEKAPRNTPPIYDVENFKHYQDVFVPGEEVVVTEKIHGSNGRFLFQPDLLGGGKMYAGSRKLWKKEGTTNIWRKILEFNQDIERWCRDNPGFVLYGEAVPTQGGFDYGWTRGRPHLYAFDILGPDGWVDYEEARLMTGGYDIEWAPLLYRKPFDLEKILPLVDGKTQTGAKHIREGVVVGTYPERHHRGLGRVKLKIVSNEYLKKEQ
jgi:RNA ligase